MNQTTRPTGVDVGSARVVGSDAEDDLERMEASPREAGRG